MKRSQTFELIAYVTIAVFVFVYFAMLVMSPLQRIPLTKAKAFSISDEDKARHLALHDDDPNSADDLTIYYFEKFGANSDAYVNWSDITTKNEIIKSGEPSLERYLRKKKQYNYQEPTLSEYDRNLIAAAMQYDDVASSLTLCKKYRAIDPLGREAEFWCEVHRKNIQIADLWNNIKSFSDAKIKSLRAEALKGDLRAENMLDLYEKSK